MDANLLKKACEVAGLDVAIEWGDPENGGMWGVYLNEEHMMMDHPALPSYVASLLVAKVREHVQSWSPVRRRRIGNTGVWWWEMTDEQRIRAALAVLEGE